MTRDVTLVYDDAVAVPDDIASLTGIDRFGGLLYRRKRLWEHASEAGQRAGFSVRTRLREHSDRLDLVDELAELPATTRFVYLTADVVCADPDLFSRFLAKVSWSDHDLVALPQGAGPGSGIASLGVDALRRLLLASRSDADRRSWWGDRRDAIERIPSEPELVCLSDAELFVRFLSGSFYTRAFNAIRQRGRSIEKRSTDKVKMRREHDYWYLLPPALQRFVVQPFDLEEDGQGASYRMDRLNMPDMAVLWIHGTDAVSESSFRAMLDVVFDWFAERPVRQVGAEGAREAAERMYVTKLRDRMDQLLALDVGARLDRVVRASTPHGGLADLVSWYERLLQVEWGSGVGDSLAVMHGDLCFSNILFDKRSRLVRFIDPRGAASEEEIWGDPYYDMAKLSHSIIGSYDFVNNGLFDVVVGEDLMIELRIAGPPRGVREEHFVERVREAGFDPVRMRLYEASLFLSMLPLHAEDPRKLLGFVLTAAQILAEVEAASTTRDSWLHRMLG